MTEECTNRCLHLHGPMDEKLFRPLPMSFNYYQTQSATTSTYEASTSMPPSVFTALGLNEEAGEVAGKIKKFYRDNLNEAETKEKIKLELGDVLWYLSETARHWGITLQEVAEGNIKKLADRRARNVIHGAGDNR
jgi:NTP pyrophosphatase (non-canonical NTP hydrolase)